MRKKVALRLVSLGMLLAIGEHVHAATTDGPVEETPVHRKGVTLVIASDLLFEPEARHFARCDGRLPAQIRS